MRFFGNPLVWLIRVRHRCGYGVHSPFAFRLLTDVVYERASYYAYRPLDRRLPIPYLLRRRKGLHLLMRLANRFQPSVIVVPPEERFVREYLHAGCRKAVIVDTMPACGADMVLLAEPDDKAASMVREGGLLLLDNLHRHGGWLHSLPASVTFDLYDLGIAVYDKKLQRQHYIVNF